MDLEHQFTVSAPIDTAWATMMDIEGVAECFPGATLTSADGDSFEGTVKVKLGPIAMVYKGSGAFAERDDSAHRAVIEAKGRDKRGNGTAGATVTMSMTESGSDTSVTVVTDLNVTGKPAQFGRGVMQDVSDKLLGQFVDCLATKVAGPAAQESAAPAAETPASADTPSGGSAADAGAGAAPATSSDSGTDSGVAAAPAAAAMPAAAVTGAAASSGRPPESASPAQPASTGAAAPASGSGSRASTGSAGARSGGGSSDSLDLGAAVMPAILRSYAPYAAVGVAGLVLGWLLGRGRRRRRAAARCCCRKGGA
ncbi:SRPBCC family protein [Janibacter cremeus]|uniref:Carbon monoxide dehydrogenase subunit G n=1 Tax=Janibacter cremeus TaxID=1285192 RepID=A0A852VSQ4_9MICO|nr:SRPBCC family protein [Janibacter cremeus]NYF97713.1 carbon monoxide dehydrogenase subunit G [Janibacter cremeus]